MGHMPVPFARVRQIPARLLLLRKEAVSHRERTPVADSDADRSVRPHDGRRHYIRDYGPQPGYVPLALGMNPVGQEYEKGLRRGMDPE